MKWLPMDKAPKDKRVQLLFKPGTFREPDFHVHFGGWEPDRYAKKPAPYWSAGEIVRIMGVRFMRQNQPIAWAHVPSLELPSDWEKS